MPEPLNAGGQTPPINPPTGCVNPLIWRLARRLYADHQPGPDGWCLNCRPAILYPCVARQLADLGLATAMERTAAGPYVANKGHHW